MSKSKQLVILSLLSILIFSFAIILSCEKYPASSSFTFEPKTYLGTYAVMKIENLAVVTIVDTMTFRFSSGNAVYIKLAIADYPAQDRNFCDVTGTYTVSGNKLEIIVDLSEGGGGFIYNNGCNLEEIPEDKYMMYTRTGELVLDGLDDGDQDIDREIVLWIEEK